MTWFVVPVLVMMLTAVAWAAYVVTVEDWKVHKIGSKGTPHGWPRAPPPRAGPGTGRPTNRERRDIGRLRGY